MPIIDFLNDNSGMITAFATVILTGITWWYVRLTKQMLRASNIPVIRMFLHVDEYYLNLCVQNIGTGFACDIKFQGDLSFKTEKQLNTKSEPLENLEPFSSGIDYLGPGHKVETYVCRRISMSQLPEHSFDIEVTYKDLANIAKSKTFPFEIGNWENTDQFGSPHTDDVADAINVATAKLQNTITMNTGNTNDNWNNPFMRNDIVSTLKRIADALEQKPSGK